jgi:hypothetical protein
VTLFSHLKDYEVKATDTLAMELTHPAFGDDPIVLKGKYCGTSNKEYNKAVMQWSATARRGSRDGVVKVGEVSDGLIAEKVALDRKLFPLHVITGWDNVKDEKGAPAAYSLEACQEFFANIPDEIFHSIHGTFSNAANFHGRASEEDAKAKGKN